MKSQAPTLDWSEAVRIEGSTEREQFIEANVDLVRYVALRIAPRLPGSVELDDLVHDGILGLLDAVSKFCPDRGVKFRTYAERRVRGAIVDGLRKKDWQPRALRRSRRELEETRARLASQFGREAGEEEIASAMGIELAELHRLMREINTGALITLDDYMEPVVAGGSDDAPPHSALEKKQLAEALAESIRVLPERELKVLELYYHEGLNMKEVGAVLGVTESRVCQLHTQAAGRLRDMLRERMKAPACAATRGSR